MGTTPVLANSGRPSPEEVPAGDVEFRLVNDDDVLVYPLVLKHLQDQPVSDAADFWGPDRSVVGNRPGWTVSIVAFGVLPGEQRASPDVLRPGTYHAACVIRETGESWFGGGFVVSE